MLSIMIQAPYCPDLTRYCNHRFIIRLRVDKLFDLAYPIAIAVVEKLAFKFRMEQLSKALGDADIPHIDIGLLTQPNKEILYTFHAETENDDIDILYHYLNMSKIREQVTKVCQQLPRDLPPVCVLWRQGL